MATPRRKVSVVLWWGIYIFLSLGTWALLHFKTWSIFEDLVILVIWFSLGILLYRSDDRMTSFQIDMARNKIQQQYQEVCLKTDDEKYSFHAESAFVVDDKEAIRQNEALCTVELTRYARNPAGEYFMLIMDGEHTPFCKYVDHNTARYVLKEKYVSPQNQV